MENIIFFLSPQKEAVVRADKNNKNKSARSQQSRQTNRQSKQQHKQKYLLDIRY